MQTDIRSFLFIILTLICHLSLGKLNLMAVEKAEPTPSSKNFENQEIISSPQISKSSSPNNSSTSSTENTLKEQSIETKHVLSINGNEVPYKSTAGTLILKDNNGKAKASIFYISYVKENTNDLKSRPITFCFNGGPGSSAVWLHLGVFGPKIISFEEPVSLNPNYNLVDNPHSLLESTDLVFIDPVSTGYSSTAAGEDPKQFHNVDEDIRSIAQFIHLYITRNGRWGSPKFIAGESYGTIRAAGLAGYLNERYHMNLNGLILVSSILNFQTNDFSPGNDLSYVLYLPTYTATAWYHKKLSPELQEMPLEELLKEVELFSRDEYSIALFKGSQLSDEDREQIIDKLSYYTGLSTQYLGMANIRVNIFRFAKELLRNEAFSIGRFDSRFKGENTDTLAESLDYDPSLESVLVAFTPAFNQYVRETLKWEKDDQYRIIGNVHPWDYSKATNQYLNVAETLREVMIKNPCLKVFVASGFFDLATPYFAAHYTFNHLNLTPFRCGLIELKDYEGGHMMYLNPTVLKQMNKDLNAFIHAYD